MTISPELYQELRNLVQELTPPADQRIPELRQGLIANVRTVSGVNIMDPDDSDLEASAGQWGRNTANFTLGRTSTNPKGGTWAGTMTATSAAATMEAVTGFSTQWTKGYPCIAGQGYIYSMHTRTTAAKTGRLWLSFWSASGSGLGALGHTSFSEPGDGVWRRWNTGVIIAPANAAFCFAHLELQSANNNQVLTYDNGMIQQSTVLSAWERGSGGSGLGVQIGGSDTMVQGVRFLGHYTPEVGDAVWVLKMGATWLALGAVEPFGRMVPVGTILPYAGEVAPRGFLLCNGAVVSRQTYGRLFNVILEIYGAGDGSTTFKLPDLRQRFPLGKAASGTGSTLGGTGGTIDGAPHEQVQASGTGVFVVDAGYNPPFQAVNYIIKT